MSRRYGQLTATERRHDHRQRLLHAGLELFGTAGYGAVSVAELCRSARVSARTFYEVCANKEALLVALHDEINAEAEADVIAAISGLPRDDLELRIRCGLRAYFRAMTHDPRRARITLVESVGVSGDADAHRRVALDRFATLIAAELDAAAADGLVEPRDHRLTAIALVGAVNELVNLWTTTTATDWPRLEDAVVAEATRLFLAGAAP